MFLARELQINLEDFESQIKKPIKIFPPSKEGQKSKQEILEHVLPFRVRLSTSQRQGHTRPIATRTIQT